MLYDQSRSLVSEWARPDGGYLVPSTALLLLPLFVFAAFAVDIGGWLNQATRAQNAADAAALAAAAQLPHRSAANAAALDLAAANNFVHGVDGVNVDVTYPDTDIVRVQITDNADFFLADLVIDDDVEISRYADALAVPPVAPGMPSNIIGFGPYSIDGSPVANYWISEGNDCTQADDGDMRAAQILDRPWCSDRGVPQDRWKRATDGRDGGYFYLIQIPPGAAATDLLIFDPGTCQAYDEKPMDMNFNTEEMSTTIYLRQWDTNQTLTRRSDDRPVSNFWTTEECVRDMLPGGPQEWTDKTQGWTRTPYSYPANDTDRTQYHLIQTWADGAKRKAANHFALWIKPTTGTSCATVPAGTCPTIAADEFLPIAIEGDGRGRAEDVFITEVHPRLAGRDLHINVWDPGELMDNLQIIDPLGRAMDFTWTTDDPLYGTDNPADNCSGRPCLYLDPKGRQYPPKYGGWKSGFKFNGRLVTLTVPLDRQAQFSQYPHFWFRLRITPPSNRWVRDWITISVDYSDDHLRLID